MSLPNATLRLLTAAMRGDNDAREVVLDIAEEAGEDPAFMAAILGSYNTPGVKSLRERFAERAEARWREHVDVPVALLSEWMAWRVLDLVIASEGRYGAWRIDFLDAWVYGRDGIRLSLLHLPPSTQPGQSHWIAQPHWIVTSQPSSEVSWSRFASPIPRILIGGKGIDDMGRTDGRQLTFGLNTYARFVPMFGFDVTPADSQSARAELNAVLTSELRLLGHAC